MNNNEMLNRIKNNSQRPSVKRDSSLESPGSQEESPSHQASANEQQPQTEAEQLKKQLEACPKIAPRRNIRLEESINQRIQQFCQAEDLSIETFLEACFLACEDNPELKQTIAQQARKRLEQRKEAGKIRRLYSQLQKLGQVE